MVIWFRSHKIHLGRQKTPFIGNFFYTFGYGDYWVKMPAGTATRKQNLHMLFVVLREPTMP